ncbi:MAG: Ig-like domain-containing protein [Thermomicrobiales bacterium]
MSALPPLTKPMTINGYSQQGAAANSNLLADGDNAKIRIELDGTNAGGTADGLVISAGAGGTVIEGLTINRFSDSGVGILGTGTTGNVIEGNYIGTNAADTTALPNSIGVNVFSASGNTIGGTTAGARNVISGNANGVAIQQSGTTNNVVAGNSIGTVGNGNDTGVEILRGASGNTIGGTAAGAGNIVAFNMRFGVSVGSDSTDTTSNTAVVGNSIHDNGGATGLDLGRDGVTANGINPRSFPNDGQNYPVLTAAYGSTVTGTLDTITNATFRVEFFASPSGATGGRNGQTFLGFITATTNGSGHADLTFTAPSALPAGSVITATATNTTTGAQMNDTSEFSAPLTIASGITATAGTPQSAIVNQAFGTALAAKVTDSMGAGLANIPVTFTAPASGASGVFTSRPSCIVANGGASATCLTNVSGVATAPPYTANGTAGADTVVASVPGVTATASFMLQNLAPLTSIALTGPGGVTALTLKVGQSAVLTATGTYADHSTQTLPPGQVQWQSSNPAVVKVDASGNVTAESPGGPVTITGTFNGMTGQITVTITAPTPIGITVPPAPQNRPGGATSEPGAAPAPAPRSGGVPLPAAGPQSGSVPSSSPAPAPVPPSR